MDLAKIIAGMRTELQCLETAIQSIEELARLQNIPLPDGSPNAPTDGDAAPESSADPAPVKRPRGRPRKYPRAETVNVTASGKEVAARGGEASAASAA